MPRYGRVTEAEVRRVVRMYPTYVLAAHALGVSRWWLWVLRKKWGIEKEDAR